MRKHYPLAGKISRKQNQKMSSGTDLTRRQSNFGFKNEMIFLNELK